MLILSTKYDLVEIVDIVEIISALKEDGSQITIC
jgi:hypothetical protein